MARTLDFFDGVESNVTPETTILPASNVSVTPAGSISSTNAQAALEEVSSDVDALYDQKGEANGIATLDAQGKIPLTQIPATAITSVFVVADIAARDLLEVEMGDVAKVLDDGSGNVATYIYTGTTWEILESDASLQIHADDTSTHGVAGDIVGTSDAQTLSNKDFDGGTASNTSRLTVPKNTKSNLDSLTRKEATIVYATDEAKAYIDNGSTLIPVGSGSGGGLNYIENGDAELTSPAPSLYADSGSSPTDGSGGSVNTSTELNFSRSTSSPLRGSGSWVFDKKSGNQQGKGGSFPFTIDVADKGKHAQITFDYSVLSGTYATGDVAVYIVHDPSGTPKVIQPSAFNIENVGIESLARLTFQTEYSSVLDYNLCFHVASTSASAYSLKFDNISLGPQVVPLGAPVTDVRNYTPTLNSNTGVATNTARSWRIGDRIYGEGWIRFNGTGAAGSLSATMDATPSNMPGLAIEPIGTFSWYDDSGSAASRGGFLRYTSGTTVNFIRNDNSSNLDSSALANNDVIHYTYSFKVAGWSSSTVVSSSADTRVVAFGATTSTTVHGSISNGAVTTCVFGTTVTDTHGGYNASTGEYTVRVPGWYNITGIVRPTGSFSSAVQYETMIYVNGTKIIGRVDELSGSAGNTMSPMVTLQGYRLKAGDVVTIRGVGSNWTSLTTASGAGLHYFSISQAQGPNQIAASEVIAVCAYRSATPQTVPNNTDTTIVFDTVETDTHGSYNASTGVFTAPAPGLYKIDAAVRLDLTIGTATVTYAYVQKNGSGVRAQTYQYQDLTAADVSLRPTDLVRLNAGDTITVRASQFSTNSGATSATTFQTYLNIHRLGGVM